MCLDGCLLLPLTGCSGSPFGLDSDLGTDDLDSSGYFSPVGYYQNGDGTRTPRHAVSDLYQSEYEKL